MSQFVSTVTYGPEDEEYQCNEGARVCDSDENNHVHIVQTGRICEIKKMISALGKDSSDYTKIHIVKIHVSM